MWALRRRRGGGALAVDFAFFGGAEEDLLVGVGGGRVSVHLSFWGCWDGGVWCGGGRRRARERKERRAWNLGGKLREALEARLGDAKIVLI